MESKTETKTEIADVSPFRIQYGHSDVGFLDVTFVAIQGWMSTPDCILHIPQGDHARASVLSDPCRGTLKIVRVTHDNGVCQDIFDQQQVNFEVPKNNIYVRSIQRLSNIHRTLRLVHGSFSEEYPEQCLAACFIQPNAKVLELGANVGRNTLVIAALLDDCANLVSLECAPDSFEKLLQNRAENANVFGTKMFHVENAALSCIPLMQIGWNTYPTPPSGNKPVGYVDVHTIKFVELEAKYNIVFDTLVADAEGALFHILQQDAPNVLKHITTVVLENDFVDINQKMYVDQVFTQFGFHRIYVQSGGFGPCFNFFYEVWAK